MITRNFVEEDLELQRYAATPKENKPRFEWGEVAGDLNDEAANRLKVRVGDQTRDFDIAEIAETVGNALTDLALSRNEENIFSDENRQLVAGIAQSVARDVFQKLEGNEGSHIASAEEMMEIIERALIRQNAHDVAKSLVIRRKSKPDRGSKSDGDIIIEGGGSSEDRGKVKTRVIRRSGENIAAVEVEAVLLQHADVINCAVCPVPDEIRGDEVFAFVVTPGDVEADDALAHDLFAHCLQHLTYFKAPGYIAFVDALPLTASQKVSRGDIKTMARQRLKSGGFTDLRHLKKRNKT